jgi:probable rRNA maturation factor
VIQIQVAEDFRAKKKISPRLLDVLEIAARLALLHAGDQPEAEATVVLSGESRLQGLNRDYLGIDAPTDVLSFPSGEIDPETGYSYLGDILISFPRAEVQAKAGGHTVEAELQLLVVHGMLHLCGYDHVEPMEKAAMWEIQSEILSRIGCPIQGPALESET